MNCKRGIEDFCTEILVANHEFTASHASPILPVVFAVFAVVHKSYVHSSVIGSDSGRM